MKKSVLFGHSVIEWIKTRFFSFFAPALKGERRKIYLFPLGIQGKTGRFFVFCLSSGHPYELIINIITQLV